MAMTDKEKNIARLYAEKGATSFSAFAEKLRLSNVKYLYDYLDPKKGHREPTQKTAIGREACEALGITNPAKEARRERDALLACYAKKKGYKSWSSIGTEVLNGGDPVRHKNDKREEV